MGFAPPLNCMDVCICMGGGFSAGMGMAKSFPVSYTHLDVYKRQSVVDTRT